MEDILFFIFALILVGVTQTIVYIVYQKTEKTLLALMPNVGLFFVGLVVALIGYLVALGEPGSWAGLGAIILVMMTAIATLISLGTSLILIYLLKQIKKKKQS